MVHYAQLLLNIINLSVPKTKNTNYISYKAKYTFSLSIYPLEIIRERQHAVIYRMLDFESKRHRFKFWFWNSLPVGPSSSHLTFFSLRQLSKTSHYGQIHKLWFVLIDRGLLFIFLHILTQKSILMRFHFY